MPLQESHFRFKETNELIAKEWKKLSSNQRRAAVVMLISDKIDIKTKIDSRNKRTFYNDITIKNTYKTYFKKT